MNSLNGTITNLQKSGAIVLADVDVNGYSFSSILIDSGEHDSWLKTGNNVSVVFKETEVSLAIGLSGKISMRNRLPCKVVSVNRGELLSKVEMQFNGFVITSVITTRSVDSLGIAPGHEAEALIKANEVFLGAPM